MNSAGKLISRIGKSQSAVAIRSGLVMIIPALLVGSIMLVLQNFPIDAYQQFIKSFLGGALLEIIVFIYNGTFGMLSVLLTVAISYCYAKEEKTKSNFRIGAVISSMAVFFILAGALSGDLSWSAFGAKGMFTAVVSSSLVPYFYFKLTPHLQLKRKPYADGADTGFMNAVGVFFPLLVLTVLFALFNTAVCRSFDVTSFHSLIVRATTALFASMGRSVFSGVMMTLLASLFWFFGIHGSDTLDAAMDNVFTPALLENQTMVAAGAAPTQILTKEFFDIFVLIGGCGTTLCLLIAILLFSKRASNRRLAKMASLPMVFNINEVMVFGLPVVYNPTLFIPFILTPLVSFAISYLAIASGLVPPVTSAVSWITPVLLGGYRATGSIAGSILQLVVVTVGVLIYRPFILAYDRKKLIESKANLNKLIELKKQSEDTLSDINITELENTCGETARTLSLDLEYAIANEELSLHYQPQYDNHGAAIGAEALLRWNHPMFGFVYPPLIIQLARETDKLIELEREIFKHAVSDAKRIWSETGRKSKISINVSASTLQSSTYMQLLRQSIQSGAIDRGCICLEITEQTALQSNEDANELFRSLRRLGYRLAIDDFSMGHTSLAYLQDDKFDLVKLDGSLVRGMGENPRCKNIIASIIQLSKSLGFEVLAEYVETEDMRSDLESIGCNQYQGYLFSPAVPIDRLIPMMKELPAEDAFQVHS